MTNQEIAQEINNRIGNSPVPFDSIYSIALNIYQELGGEERQFDSVYSILLETLNVIDSGISAKVIDDSSISLTKTWSSSKIASELADAGFNVEIVTELPSVGDPHTIYFILKSDSSTGDVYDEWMYIDGNWEMVGNTQIDLSDYATIANVDASLALKADKTYVDSSLALKADKSYVDASLALKADLSYVDASLALKADTYEVATLADILALFVEPVPPTQPNDEIWYTTNNNEAITIDPESAEYYFDKPILSNTYSDGKGIIKFDGDLTSIEDAFYNITENYDILTSVSIPESVTNLAYGSYLFSNCSNLTTVKLPTNYEGGIGESFFSGCENLETVIIPEGTTYIGDGAFGGCISLTTITIPSNVTSIGPSAFGNCESLTSIVCEPTTPPEITDGNPFYSENDYPIYVPAESVNAYKSAEGWTEYVNRIEAIQ